MTTADRLNLETHTEPGLGPAFRSVLFRRELPLAQQEPPYFHDLALDQLVDALTAGREEYDLAPLLWTPLTDEADIRYRQDVLRDLDAPDAREIVRSFARGMREVREALKQAHELRYPRQKQAWFLDGVDRYCDAVRTLLVQLQTLDLRSGGVTGLRRYLDQHIASPAFTQLEDETHELVDQLAAVRYAVEIRGLRVTVLPFEDEPDYSAEVLSTFERFKQGAVHDYRSRFSTLVEMNHVEAQILDRVALLFPDVFARLAAFTRHYGDFVDKTIGRFDREAQVYLSYLDLIGPLRNGGLGFCVPRATQAEKTTSVDDAFDLMLALKLHRDGQRVVRNGFSLADDERVLIVSGPNQGGKTTFARMFGQLHFLASLGLSVPGRNGRLFLPDALFTHFEREESVDTLHGKLEDELVRVHEILDRATGNSIVVMNESFSSTTVDDATLLSRSVLDELIERDTFTVYVTFLDELSSLPKTVSMVSGVDPDNPTARTFRIERRPADGLAYAAAIARKYGLSYEQLTARLGQ